jgi:carbonic anhydrase
VEEQGMDLEQIFKNNDTWIAKKLEVDPDYFYKLGQPQTPEILYIGCSDSRVSAEELMGLEPGQAFVHRNIANMVVSIDVNLMSVLKFAIRHLKVKHVIVCGHYGCGGVRAAMRQEDLGILNPWLGNIRDVYRSHKLELNAISDETARYNRLIELNVQEQCINLIKTAAVQQAYKQRLLKVHGWVFDIYTGKLIDLKIPFDDILKQIMEIYDLGV